MKGETVWAPVTTELHPALLIEARVIGGDEETTICYSKTEGLHLSTDLEHLGCMTTPLRWNPDQQCYENYAAFHNKPHWKRCDLERPATLTPNQLRLQLHIWATKKADVQLTVNGVASGISLAALQEALGALNADLLNSVTL